MDAATKDTFEFKPAGIIMEFNPEKSQLTLRQNGNLILFTREK
jgi:D-alanyl-D-alanine carboxypeptidase